ncbi:hypothetical protein TRICHSKD4_4715 [Roseibium sp. TrichSKD4]|nr:hypothetical protein TRICHSKD4_4715 [Roseibium sp. TrichSKD4]
MGCVERSGGFIEYISIHTLGHHPALDAGSIPFPLNLL